MNSPAILEKEVTVKSQNPIAKTANTLRIARCCASLALVFAGAASADDGFPQDPHAWLWPVNLTAPARVYQCSPATSRHARDLVMVWTDKTNKVVAFGAVAERGQIPAYAQALGNSAPAKFAAGTRADEGPDAIRTVRLAGRGHEVISTNNQHSLKVMDISLGCIASIDE